MGLVQAEPVLQLPGGLELQAPNVAPERESQEPSTLRYPVPSVPLKLSMGCPNLDALLSGGIPSRSVTELVGESTCGKTQLCLQLMLACRMAQDSSGNEGTALCVYTEGRFPVKRLMGLASSPTCASANGATSAKQLCEGIFLRELQNISHVLQFLETDVIRMLRNPPRGVPVRILVLDSVAALFRSDYDYDSAEDMHWRAGNMFYLSHLLRYMAEQFDIAVVVTNQVVELIEDGAPNVAASQMSQILMSAGRPVMPALGLAWSNCVSTRVFLSLESWPFQEVGDHEKERQGLRTMQVVFSPHLSERSCDYRITSEGVRGLPDSLSTVLCLGWLGQGTFRAHCLAAPLPASGQSRRQSLDPRS